MNSTNPLRKLRRELLCLAIGCFGLVALQIGGSAFLYFKTKNLTADVRVYPGEKPLVLQSVYQTDTDLLKDVYSWVIPELSVGY